MNNFLEIIGKPFLIQKIIIYNFTVLDTELKIEIEIESSSNVSKRIVFEGVRNLNIVSSHYGCSDKSSITVEDLSTAQMEEIRYKVAVSEDVMTFYCLKILME